MKQTLAPACLNEGAIDGAAPTPHCAALWLQTRLPADEHHLPLTLSFPEGTLIGIAKERLPVVVSCTATRPTSFTANVDFLDDDGKRYSLPVTGTSDACLLSIKPFLDVRCWCAHLSAASLPVHELKCYQRGQLKALRLCGAALGILQGHFDGNEALPPHWSGGPLEASWLACAPVPHLCCRLSSAACPVVAANFMCMLQVNAGELLWRTTETSAVLLDESIPYTLPEGGMEAIGATVPSQAVSKFLVSASCRVFDPFGTCQ